MLAHLSLLPDDPILGLAHLYREDARLEKVDLGIGIYKDVQGGCAVLQSVKQAEAWLLAHQQSKAYTSTSGAEGFAEAIAPLVLGAQADSARVIQTPGATGALRLAAELARRCGIAQVAIGQPTWPLHSSQFQSAGVQPVGYTHLDEQGRFNLAGLLDSLQTLQPGSLVLLQGACHNPTGIDPTPEQWGAILELMLERRLIPLFDLAYQGFGEGLEQDAQAVRRFCEHFDTVWIATSCSKNFALYRERTGALLIAGRDQRSAGVLESHALQLARGLWSMPPAHGAQVVVAILASQELRALWQQELQEMRERIHGLRGQLVAALSGQGGERFATVARQSGMFSYLGLTPEDVKTLRAEHGIYLVGSGRVNVSGLDDASVGRLARAVGQLGEAR